MCVIVAAMLALALSGCSRRHATSAPTVRVPSPAPPESAETGLASWYGHPYHGRPAADGEVYDMDTMVAAHRTLPFGTWVRVADLDNGKTVDVRIIDRGPFVAGRIIDLSHAAAEAIGMIGPGLARVRLDVLSSPSVASAVFAVQVGAFADRSRADLVRSVMEQRFGNAQLVTRTGNPTLWRVLVGTQSTEDAAGQLARQLAGEGYQCFVVRLDDPPVRASR